MNWWRLLVILALALSLGVLAGVAIYGTDAENEFRPAPSRFQANHPEFLDKIELPPLWLSIFGSLAALSLSGLLVLYLFPERVRRMQAACSTPLLSLARLTLLGIVGGILLVVTGISAVFTMVTFPIAIILGGIVFLVTYTGLVAIAYALGRTLLRRAGWEHLSPISAFLLGLVVLYALSSLPYLGIIFRLIIISLAIGVVISTRFGSGKLWNLQPLIEE